MINNLWLLLFHLQQVLLSPCLQQKVALVAPLEVLEHNSYYSVGPAGQLPGFGWSLGQWGGTVSGEAQTSLNGGINASTTTIVLTDATLFPSSGTSFIQIGNEEISYTGISGNTLTGVTRGVRNTTAASHSNADTVTNSTDYVAWGEAASGDLVVDPGMWSIDNFGDKIIALIHNGQVFEWDSNASGATSTRATVIIQVHQQHQET